MKSASASAFVVIWSLTPIDQYVEKVVRCIASMLWKKKSVNFSWDRHILWRAWLQQSNLELPICACTSRCINLRYTPFWRQHVSRLFSDSQWVNYVWFTSLKKMNTGKLFQLFGMRWHTVTTSTWESRCSEVKLAPQQTLTGSELYLE